MIDIQSIDLRTFQNDDVQSLGNQFLDFMEYLEVDLETDEALSDLSNAKEKIREAMFWASNAINEAEPKKPIAVQYDDGTVYDIPSKTWTKADDHVAIDPWGLNDKQFTCTSLSKEWGKISI
jgi:hypothetical protein